MGLTFHFILASDSGLGAVICQVFLLLCFILSHDSSNSRAFIEILDTKFEGNESPFKLHRDSS